MQKGFLEVFMAATLAAQDKNPGGARAWPMGYPLGYRLALVCQVALVGLVGVDLYYTQRLQEDISLLHFGRAIP